MTSDSGYPTGLRPDSEAELRPRTPAADSDSSPTNERTNGRTENRAHLPENNSPETYARATSGDENGTRGTTHWTRIIASEADVVELLDMRYSQTNPGNGPRYATASRIKSSAGFYARRQMDYFAMDLWPSSGLRRIGHEIKCSRSDWLRELKDPTKAEAFRPYMHRWYLVVTDAKFVKPGELPAGWGLIVTNWTGTRVRVAAREIEPLPLPDGMLACLLRATQVHHFKRGFAQRGSLWEREHA